MITVAAMAKEQDLGEREMLAVCRLAGIEAGAASDLLTSEQAMHVRDVLAGRVIPKAPKRRSPMLSWKVLATVGAALMFGIVMAIVGGALSGPARVAVMAGDCFNEPPILGATLDPVPCGGPHKYRAFARMELGVKYGEIYPGVDVVEAHVKNRCEALHDGGGEADLFGYVNIYYFYPEQSAWDRGARAAVCATMD